MESKQDKFSFEEFRVEVLKDYKLAMLSRHVSLMGRKEVLLGRAKFGIFGDGKEVAQIAMAKTFKEGDWRAGYYRDQTFMLATGMMSVEEMFAQLYGDTSLDRNPSNGGRAMNNHFATRTINADGTWKDLAHLKNSSADISCTAGQMPRLLGLAYASKLFRKNKDLKQYTTLSSGGNEVAFGTIGDASTSEGHFWETINAAGVLQVPMAISVWDDAFGISVPKKLQTTKESISVLVKGFEQRNGSNGLKIFHLKGWDYVALVKTYAEGVEHCRKHHVPVLFHVDELTQPLGHSSSGSQERYKSSTQLMWEKENDCVVKMKEWILEKAIASEDELTQLENEALTEVKLAKRNAWKAYRNEFDIYKKDLVDLVTKRKCQCLNQNGDKIDAVMGDLDRVVEPVKEDMMKAAKKIVRYVCNDCFSQRNLKESLQQWIKEKQKVNYALYSEYLYTNVNSSSSIERVKPYYSGGKIAENGSDIIRRNFDALLEKDSRIVVFGEDSGKLGDVNQGLAGLQDKYGEFRVTDTGIRETTIIGQGIGLAMRGLRPIAEIQYLDYLLYALQTMSDDLATLHWRTVGGQKAPLIVRTRGHRLEGIWHSGSPMSLLINSLRGVNICVPRNMTQAAAFYNTLLQCDDPALVIEPLNAYRLKEPVPENFGEFTMPLGIPEVLEEGSDITIVTYASCVRIAQVAMLQLKEFNISVELIDVQTLLPFDVNHLIVESIKKTGKVIFFDEDVPGGASAYMMQKVMEEQGAFYYLDAAPKTLCGRDHRPAYTSDGDYFSNPNADDVFEMVYGMMTEYNPSMYPKLI